MRVKRSKKFAISKKLKGDTPRNYGTAEKILAELEKLRQKTETFKKKVGLSWSS